MVKNSQFVQKPSIRSKTVKNSKKKTGKKTVNIGQKRSKRSTTVNNGKKKLGFWESVSFHREMFGATSFGLVLQICIVNAMIFIKKNIDKLVQDQLLQTVKDHQYDKFGYVGKIMHCVFFHV